MTCSMASVGLMAWGCGLTRDEEAPVPAHQGLVDDNSASTESVAEDQVVSPASMEPAEVQAAAPAQPTSTPPTGALKRVRASRAHGRRGPGALGGGNYQAGERYAKVQENRMVDAAEDNRSTFSLDVDTASYTIMRRDLRNGTLPQPDSVRIEEFINFFDYNDAPPSSADDAPFATHLEAAPSPFGDGRYLLRVGVQAVEVPADQRPRANLVFLIDVSGSMGTPNKLGLVQYAMNTLVNTLRPDDTIGIVVYAGREAIILEPTAVENRGTILEAIRNLEAGGSTNGAAGIRAAYDLATRHFQAGGINRVILCTDGDFNVGVTGNALISMVEQYRNRGVTLTTLGFGMGNYNDRDMEQLADRGNGNYAYIDSRNEALRLLQRDLGGTLQVIAKDVKVQVEFNSDVVESFRLVGYENRVLQHQDFTNDAIDAAEIGSGQFITAFLEIQLREGVSAGIDPRELAQVRIRYKAPDGNRSMEVSHGFNVEGMHRRFEDATPVFRFGTAVTEFAEILRRSEHSRGQRFDDVERIAREANWNGSSDAGELLELVSMARGLWR